MRHLIASTLLLAALEPAHAAACGAFRRLAAPTQEGLCAGIVAEADAGLRIPRTVLWIGREGDVEHLLVVDMGSWEPQQGRLLHVQVDGRGGGVRVAQLLGHLDRPHGLRRGPDGQVYLAEATRVLRLEWKPGAARVVTQRAVDGLPAAGRHPLKELAFAPDGSLFIGGGAPSDDCADGRSVQGGLPQCPEMEGAQPQAAVYRARFDAAGRLAQLKVFARGLRNSMALAVHASGTVLQAENSMDAGSTERFPADEVNRLEEGAHYGWPGCVERRKPLPGFDAAACERTQLPVLLMPAHAAPLHMEYSGKALLVGWHGYRKAGQRIVRYAVDARGVPKGRPVTLLGPWKLGAHRLGAPVGWGEDDRGQLWIADDRNRMLLVLRRDE